ncbi:hypothetical protein [Nonomuraea wenchangensis]|uniref:hypothetical protein n=1 Tax=Nonomuraea wenchangensis TaxID=568860 RepID=UPI00331726B7
MAALESLAAEFLGTGKPPIWSSPAWAWCRVRLGLVRGHAGPRRALVERQRPGCRHGAQPVARPEEHKPLADLSAFATHVHGARIQTAGLPHLADDSRILTGDPGERRFAERLSSLM